MRRFDFDAVDQIGQPKRLTRHCSVCGAADSERREIRPTQFAVATARPIKWANTIHWACQICRRKWQGFWRLPSYHPQQNVNADFVCYASQYVADLRVLTLSEPWAWLVTEGYKDLENRKQHFSFTGRMFIHSAKQLAPNWEGIRQMVGTHNGIILPSQEWFNINRCGRITGVMEVGTMVSHHESAWKLKGQWAWPIKWCYPVNATEVVRGFQGFWRVPSDNMRISCLPL